MIPRRAFHLWLSEKPESRLAVECLRSWDKLGFDIEHITLANCDRSELFVQQALDAGTIEGRVKANDFLRVQYLHERGGVYLDDDVEVLRSFDDLMEYGCFLGAEDDQLVNMAVLGAVPGHWLLAELLEAMREFRGNGPESPVSFSLGTATRLLRKHGWRGNQDFIKDGLRVFPSSAFYPIHWKNAVTPEARNSGAYTIHHWNMAWNQTVSVVIPCFNYGHYLAECLDSALSQTYPHVEVIVVDDGSTDNTAQIVARYSGVRYIHQSNSGLSAARNAGIRASRGQYIQPLDADDKLAPTSIEKCVALLDGADIAVPGQQEFEASRHFYGRATWRMELPDFLSGNRIHCASMYRRKAWEQVGGYDERMLDGYEDWDFWIRIISAGYSKIRVIDEPLFLYRVHADSMLRNMLHKKESVTAYMRSKYAAAGLGAARLAC
jgi:glycosyl transferase family 2/glycosyl transferase-like sugar-binding protein